MANLDEAGASTDRRRRRRRTGITLAVVGLLLVGVFACAAAYVQGWMGELGRPGAGVAACPAPTNPPTSPAPGPTPTRTLSPEDVTVNIYNTTPRQGLARTTASTLRDRGYLIATVSNDPMHRTIRGVAEIRYGTSGTAAARLAARLVPGASLHRDGRPDSSVDLVLGPKFHGVASLPGAAPSAAAGC